MGVSYCVGIYSVRVALCIRIASRVKSGGGAFRDAPKATLCALKHYSAVSSSYGPNAHDYLTGASALSDMS